MLTGPADWSCATVCVVSPFICLFHSIFVTIRHSLSRSSCLSQLPSQRNGLSVSGVMAVAAWFRVWVFGLGSRNATAISLSCFMIVTMSVLAGTVLPFALRTVGLDPGHAGAAVQVVMDVMGCLITCAICSMVLSVTSTLTGAEILQDT